jgi:hypothetical protein
MAGLLDFFGNGWDDPKSNAVMALAGGLLDGDFAGGMKGYAGVMAGAPDVKLKRAMQQAQMDELTSQNTARLDAIKQKQASADEQRRIGQLVANAGRPTLGGGATGIVNDALPEVMRIGSMNALPNARQAGDFDYTGLMQQGVPFDILKNLAASRNLGREEVARVQDIEGANGGKTLQGFDKYGRPVGDGANGYVEPKLINLGDRQVFMKPSAGLSMNMGQSPDSKASNALGWANHGISAANLSLSRDRLNMDKSDPKLAWNESLGGFVNPRTREVLPALDAKGNPVASNKAEKPLTEDQGKATGWLIQAENAHKNMREAVKADPSAVKPGFNDVLANVPSMGMAGGAANMMRGAERQKYLQGASSLSESLLRAATGAGVNKDEALQKVRELTPQIGDSDEVIKQKDKAIPLYIESLKIRAGGGAKKAEGITEKLVQESKNIVDTLPPANTSNRGQRIRDTTTGKILKSNGMSWVAE